MLRRWRNKQFESLELNSDSALLKQFEFLEFNHDSALLKQFEFLELNHDSALLKQALVLLSLFIRLILLSVFLVFAISAKTGCTSAKFLRSSRCSGAGGTNKLDFALGFLGFSELCG